MYKDGFGTPDQELWLGNDYIHGLAESWGGSELYVELTDYEDETRVARYGKFAIGSESDKYKLIIDEYKSSPNDAGKYNVFIYMSYLDH